MTANASNGGATWTLESDVISGAYNPILKATPGEAGDLWLASGICGNPGLSQPCLSSLYHSTDGGSTWTTVADIAEPYAIGFGAPAPGHAYPTVHTAGYYMQTSTSSITIRTGTQTFAVTDSSGFTVGDVVDVQKAGYGTNSMVGAVTNSNAGSVTIDVTSAIGSGTSSSWQIATYGIWRSIDEGNTWTQIGTWPNGYLDSIRDIAGDPNVYGKVYIALAGAGYAFYSADGPSIRAVNFSPTSGADALGATTTITLDLSEAATVSAGTPTLSLNDGGTATYTSGSGTNALDFTYTVGSCQNTSSLTANALNLHGATIEDSGGNPINNSLSGVFQLGPQVSTLPASVTAVTMTPSTGTLDYNNSATLTLDMSTPVTISGGTPTLSLNDAGMATYTSGSGTNALDFTYAVGSGQNTSSLAATAVNLNGAIISNANGNANQSLSGLTQTGPAVTSAASSSITYESEATSTTASSTVNYGALTWGSSCPDVVLAIGAFTTNAGTVASVSVGGESASEVSGAASPSGYGANSISDIWEFATSSSSGNVQVTYSNPIAGYGATSLVAAYCLNTTSPAGTGTYAPMRIPVAPLRLVKA